MEFRWKLVKVDIDKSFYSTESGGWMVNADILKFEKFYVRDCSRDGGPMSRTSFL